jgi:hypothetical protein
MIDEYLKPAISNGNPREQALVRRWWNEEKGCAGTIVFEYYLEGFYADAIWFPDAVSDPTEHPGKSAPSLFPLNRNRIVLCEAKLILNPEVIGQALTYSQLALNAGAIVDEVIIFCENASSTMERVVTELHLSLVNYPRDAEAPNRVAGSD